MERIQWLNDNGYINPDGTISHTRSTKFLLPLVGITEMDIEKLDVKLLINVHFLIKETKIKIIVVLNDEVINDAIRYWIECQGFNENYEGITLNKNNDFLLTYNLPEHFRDDFNHFIEGEYSKTSDEYKAILTRVYGYGTDKNDYRPTMYECLHPTDDKRKKLAEFLEVDNYKIIGEVSVKPNKRYEFFHTLEELTNLTFLQ